MNDCKKLNCSFCSYPSMDYLKTVEKKENDIARLYSNYSTLIEPFEKMEEPFNYRHKVIASFQSVKGKIIAGLYEENSHKLIITKDCMLQSVVANEIIDSVVNLANQFKLEAFNEDRLQGLLRHIQIRVGYYTKEVLVTLVLGEKVFKSRQNFIKALRLKHPEITSIVCNYNNRKTSVVLGKEELVSFGPGFIYDKIGGLKFKISSQSFYQVNPKQTEKLYAKALELAQISKDDLVLDTYSGIGTMSLLASQYARKVIGVEVNQSAVSDARFNAKLNRIANVDFMLEDASLFMQRYKGVVDILLMDPTRKGSDEDFLNAVLKLLPRKVIYVSCDPTTQYRDIDVLLGEYRIDAIQGFDLFPFTTHCECIISLVRR